ASVGRSEAEAREVEPDLRVYRVELTDVDRARIDGCTEGFAKVVATTGGKILGATIVAPEASLVIQEIVVALEHGLGLNDLAATVHTYPTMAGLVRSIANQYAATRLESGIVRTALRWIYGFEPRDGEGSTGANGDQVAEARSASDTVHEQAHHGS